MELELMRMQQMQNGLASFVNKPSWQIPKGVPAGWNLPTYPDGRSVL